VTIAVDSTGAVRTAGYTSRRTFRCGPHFFSTVFAGVAKRPSSPPLMPLTGRSLVFPVRRKRRRPNSRPDGGWGRQRLSGRSDRRYRPGTAGATKRQRRRRGWIHRQKFRQWLRNPLCTYLGASETTSRRRSPLIPRGISTSPERPTPRLPPGRSVAIPPSMEIQRSFVSQDLQLRRALLWSSYLSYPGRECLRNRRRCDGVRSITGPTLSPDFPTTPAPCTAPWTLTTPS